MRTIYVDLGELDQSGALGLISSKVQILPAGAVIRTEQAEIRAEVPRYQEMAERAGVFFFFEDEELPELPFFAVPRPGAGGPGPGWQLVRPLGGPGGRVCTASPRRGLPSECQRTWAGFSSRLLAGEEVREMWEPAPGLRVYPSKAEAAGTDPAGPALRTGPGGTGKGENRLCIRSLAPPR